MFEVTDEVRDAARREFTQGPLSAALRRLAQRFDLHSPNLAWLATEVFDNMMLSDVQAIWRWDLSGDGIGHSDGELDVLLAHLRVGTPDGAGLAPVASSDA